jgi:hypothetical protein
MDRTNPRSVEAKITRLTREIEEIDQFCYTMNERSGAKLGGNPDNPGLYSKSVSPLLEFRIMAVSIPEIDSSDWAVDPRQYGMSAGEYIQAESRAFFADFLARAAINEFFHFTTLTKASDHWVVSPNLDTIYSLAVVNTRDGFALQLPDVGERFLSTQIITEEHLTPFYLYGGGRHEFSASDFATDFVVVGVRMGTDGTAQDVRTIVEQLQPQYAIERAASGSDLTPVDKLLLEKVRAALMPEYSKLPNTFGAMQKRAEDVRDWEYFTYVTAGAWGLSADENAMYALGGAADAKGGACYVATFPKVPAEAFFSVTAYGPQKYLMTDSDNVVGSNHGVKLEADGSFKVAFGGEACRSLAPNFLATPEDGWSILLRAYRPEVAAFKTYRMPTIEKID